MPKYLDITGIISDLLLVRPQSVDQREQRDRAVMALQQLRAGLRGPLEILDEVWS